MGQITQILVVKTVHFKDGTKQHKNELYQCHMIFYYDTYETDDLYANRKYRLTMKQQTEQNDKLVKLSPVEYMNQYSNCTPDFIEAWKSFAQYWQIKTE